MVVSARAKIFLEIRRRSLTTNDFKNTSAGTETHIELNRNRRLTR
jgi:hypothetical protein